MKKIGLINMANAKLLSYLIVVIALMLAASISWKLFDFGYEIYTLDEKMSKAIRPSVSIDSIPDEYKQYLRAYPADAEGPGWKSMRKYAQELGLDLGSSETLYTISKGHMNFYFTTLATESRTIKRVIREKS